MSLGDLFRRPNLGGPRAALAARDRIPQHVNVFRMLRVAAAVAAVGIVVMPAVTAIADDEERPSPSAPIIRDSPRGVVMANSELRWAQPGAVYSDGSDASAGAPILIRNGNQAPLCFANGEFSPFTQDC